jgi:hypothetical protein
METFWLLGERSEQEQEKHAMAESRKIRLHHSGRKGSSEDVVSRKRAKEERLRQQESGSEASSIPTRRQQRRGNRRSVNFTENELESVDLDAHVGHSALSDIPSSRSSRRPSLLDESASTPLMVEGDDIHAALTVQNLQEYNELASSRGSSVAEGSVRSIALTDNHRSESVL